MSEPTSTIIDVPTNDAGAGEGLPNRPPWSGSSLGSDQRLSPDQWPTFPYQTRPAAPLPETCAPRRLSRARQGRWIGGVAGGLADYWDIDPVITRIGFALLGLFGGMGILVYLIAWVSLPSADAPHSPLGRLFAVDTGGRHLNLHVLILATLLLPLSLRLAPIPGALLGVLTGFPLTGLVRFLLVLAYLGMVGWLAAGGDARLLLEWPTQRVMRHDRSAAPPSQPDLSMSETTVRNWSDGSGSQQPTGVANGPSGGDGPTEQFPTALSSVGLAYQAQQAPCACGRTERSSEQDLAKAALAAEHAQRRAEQAALREQRRLVRAAARAERKSRNRWGRLVSALTLLCAGTLALSDQAEWTRIGYAGIGIVALSLLAAGVLAGAWFGSARWLIAPGLTLAVVLAGQQAQTSELNRLQALPPTATALDSLPAGMHRVGLPNGNNVLDLRTVRKFNGQALDLEQVAGTLTVILPSDVSAEVDSRVVIGQNTMVADASGFNQHGSRVIGPTGTPDGQSTPELYVRALLLNGTFQIKTQPKE